jgi:uncharacterized phage protein (TIGR02220 family)
MTYIRSYVIRDTIDYLNSIAGTQYSHGNEETINLIFSLMERGYTLDDFKLVIDKKWQKWKGTKYQSFVRPSTLFGKNFENYLNEQSASNPIQKLADSVRKAKQTTWKLDKRGD